MTVPVVSMRRGDTGLTGPNGTLGIGAPPNGLVGKPFSNGIDGDFADVVGAEG